MPDRPAIRAAALNPEPHLTHAVGEEIPSEMAIASVALLADGEALSIVFESGSKVELAAGHLWRACPSAAGRRRRLDGRNTAPPGLRIKSLHPVGRYAVNLGFSDGHDRGIYPWGYLLDLALQPTVDDFILAD